MISRRQIEKSCSSSKRRASMIELWIFWSVANQAKSLGSHLPAMGGYGNTDDRLFQKRDVARCKENSGIELQVFGAARKVGGNACLSSWRCENLQI